MFVAKKKNQIAMIFLKVNKYRQNVLYALNNVTLFKITNLLRWEFQHVLLHWLGAGVTTSSTT